MIYYGLIHLKNLGWTHLENSLFTMMFEDVRISIRTYLYRMHSSIMLDIATSKQYDYDSNCQRFSLTDTRRVVHS